MYRRVSAQCTALYLTSSAFRQGVVRDVSLNGFRIEGQSPLPCNTIVMVRLWFPDQEDSVDIDQAVVRWASEQEFGLQIVALSNEADYRIASHVEQMLQKMTMNAVA
jgi:hypothetical protein